VKILLKKSIVITGSLFFAVFAVSLILYIVQDKTKEKRVLFFTVTNSSRFIGEIRYLQKKASQEDGIAQIIEEAVLGPENEKYFRIVPRNTRVLSVMLRDNKLYIDFSYDVLLYDRDVKAGIDERFKILTNTIIFNYPFIKKVFYFVNGEPFLGSAMSSGLVFTKGLFY